MEIIQLKEHIKNMTTELYDERRKWRSEMGELENGYLQKRKEETEKVKNIEYKCLMVETELSNYKNMEAYVQNEAQSMRDEEEMYNSIREQIDRINGDWNKLDNEKSLEIERMRQQDTVKSHKMT